MRIVLLGIVAISLIIASTGAVVEGKADGPIDASRVTTFLKELKDDHKFTVWPYRFRYVQAIGDETPSSFDSLIEDYDQRFAAFFRTEPFPNFPIFPKWPDITVVYYRGEHRALRQIVSRQNNVAELVMKKLSRMEQQNGPCRVLAFTSRDTWMHSGLLAIDFDKLNKRDEANQCLFWGLDVLNGYPSKEYTQSNVLRVSERNLLIWSIYYCSMASKPSKSSEKTRDGYHALPSLGCVQEHVEKMYQQY